MKKLGYARKDKGWESEAQYDARQCAIFSLYCAIMQTEPTGKGAMFVVLSVDVLRLSHWHSL